LFGATKNQDKSFNRQIFILVGASAIVSASAKKKYEKGLILSKVIYEKLFFALLPLIDSCQQVVMRNKFALKTCFTDCRVRTIVKRLCLVVDELF